MRKSLALAAVFLASSALAATPATAAEYLFDENGDSYSLDFDGFGGDPIVNIPGLTSTLDLTLTSGIGTDTLTFSYVLTNASTVGGNGGRVSGFAFDSNPNAAGGSASGAFTNLNLGGNYPNAIGTVEACLSNNNGNGCSGSGGAFVGAPATGSFTLAFGSNISSLTLTDFHVRYQGLSGLNGITSATGSDVTAPVPEPGTWAMMLFGFGAVGGAMRAAKRRKKLVTAYA